MNTNLKIFIVDNDLSTLNRYQQCLENMGYTNIQLFLSCKTCIENLYQKPGIVFLNRGMDDKSGSEFLEKIKYYHPIIPVIILSEHSIAKNSFDVLNYNICGYMLKDNNDLEKIKYFLDSLSSKKKEIEKIDCI